MKKMRSTLRVIGCLVVVGCSAASSDQDPLSGDSDEVGAQSANLLQNPSFESNTTGWGSYNGSLSRVAVPGAPSGSYVVRVTRSQGVGYSLDDAPDTVASGTKGDVYSASVYVSTATSATVGKTISLIIREKTQQGATVNLSQKSVALTKSFQKISVSGSVQTTGNVVDLYVYQDGAAAGDTFYADALSLTKTLPTSPDAGVPVGSSPSGQAMPTGDLPGWKLKFTDDFTTNAALGSFPGTAYGAKWTAYPDPWKDTSKNGTYSPAKTLSVKNGVLTINCHTENGVHYVSAPEPMSGQGQLYGRYSVRVRATQTTRDYKTAWLLWPDSGVWPGDGEIDFPEGNLNSNMNAFAHHANAGGGQDAFTSKTTYAAWHTVTTEWAPGSLSFYIDGVKLGTSTNQVPSKSMHYVMQTETNLDGVVPSNTSVGTLEVDWVAIWSKI